MKKSFRDAYERELDILYERSAEFAGEFPGLADRLSDAGAETVISRLSDLPAMLKALSEFGLID